MSIGREEIYCDKENCERKNCESCNCKKTTAPDITDSFRTGKGVSPNGYYSSGGIIRIIDKDGKEKFVYARPSGD
ncbi:MAG: hypothetical protein E7314_03895 [Clostridiales bacterium]|nr:hypothetical protein [Clostridiales bacterium]